MKEIKTKGYVLLGLKALHRAAVRAAKEAQLHNQKLPVMKKGHLVYVSPEVIIRKNIEAQRELNPDNSQNERF